LTKPRWQIEREPAVALAIASDNREKAIQALIDHELRNTVMTEPWHSP
jgi:hypothetical protein